MARYAMPHALFTVATVGAAVLLPTTTDAKPAPPGADTPFTTYEAESAATDGARIGPGHAFTRIEAEASGRRAVALEAGQHVEFTLAGRADAVNVRYSVPDGSADAPLHVSAGGKALTDLTLTARYSHVYGNYPFTDDPADGGEHHYFDDVHALLGRTLPAGTRVRLTATAPVVVDLADFEQAGPARPMPAGYLSATDFGADPTGAADSGAAIQAAVDAGAAQGRGVWLPAGTYLGAQRSVDRIVMRLPANWGARVETVAVAADGAPLVAAAEYELDPDTGNSVTIAIPATTVRTLTLTFTGNTGWPAAQLSELEVYAH